MTPDDREQLIFGLFDGVTSALGMVLALAATGNVRGLVVAAVALAVGAAVSMGAGEWLSDTSSSLHRAAVMASATLAGSVAPALPFLIFAGVPAFVVCAALTVLTVVVIAEARPGAPLPSYTKTAGVLLVATTLGVGASLLAGAA